MNETLYGVAELARAAGVKPRTLAAYLARGHCPPPDVRLECGPVWYAASVAPWLETRQRRLDDAESRAEAAIRVVASGVKASGVFRAQGNVDHRGRYEIDRTRHRYHQTPDSLVQTRRDRYGDTMRQPTRAVDVDESCRLEAYRIITDPGHQDADIAESMLGNGLVAARRALVKADNARARQANRQTNRSGSPDGIPF